jgi:hypothetical protein
MRPKQVMMIRDAGVEDLDGFECSKHIYIYIHMYICILVLKIVVVVVAGFNKCLLHITSDLISLGQVVPPEGAVARQKDLSHMMRAGS